MCVSVDIAASPEQTLTKNAVFVCVCDFPHANRLCKLFEGYIVLHFACIQFCQSIQWHFTYIFDHTVQKNSQNLYAIYCVIPTYIPLYANSRGVSVCIYIHFRIFILYVYIVCVSHIPMYSKWIICTREFCKKREDIE